MKRVQPNIPGSNNIYYHMSINSSSIRKGALCIKCRVVCLISYSRLTANYYLTLYIYISMIAQSISQENIEILASISKGERYLIPLESC